MRLTTKEFIDRADSVHNGKYDYSKVEYINTSTKVCIKCPEHGEFWQTPNNHLHGYGCPECKKQTLSKLKKKTQETFIQEARSVHGDKYDFSEAVYIDSTTKVKVICPEHGEFLISPHDILKGVGCVKCARVYSPTTEEFIKKARSIHGEKYDYSKTSYVNNRTKITIICPEHGEFKQTPHNHLAGQGCPYCGCEKRTKHNTYTNEQFIDKANAVHMGKYIYAKTHVEDGKYVTITCPKHGDFTQSKSDHLMGCGCPKCGMVVSKGEDEIFDYVSEFLDKNAEKRVKNLLWPMELDIYSPSNKIAIEFDGVLWHSEKYRPDKFYHLNKTNACKKIGIRLLHVFEDEWTEKKPIVLSMLNNIFGKTKRKIYARQCEIRNVKPDEKNSFLEENHLQGKCPSTYAYGLYHDGELVSLMTFGKLRQQKRFNEDYDTSWELLRFCNSLNTTVIGGASRLLKHFITVVKPSRIVTYADKRWSDGNLYFKLGFHHKWDSKPNYHYVINGRREPRFKYRKGELIKQGFDNTKSEHEIMMERKIYRIYDCGSIVFEMRPTTS